MQKMLLTFEAVAGKADGLRILVHYSRERGSVPILIIVLGSESGVMPLI